MAETCIRIMPNGKPCGKDVCLDTPRVGDLCYDHGARLRTQLKQFEQKLHNYLNEMADPQ